MHKYSFFSRKSLRTLCIVTASTGFAFVLGIETAGEVQPVVSATHAGDSILSGDFNGNGLLDINDVKIALELAQGYRSPTPSELSVDPNRDFTITIDDAMTMIDILQQQPSQPAVRL